MPRLAGALAIALLLTACSQSAAPSTETPTTTAEEATTVPDAATTTTAPPGRPPFCGDQWMPRETGTVTDPTLGEISGAAVSRSHPGVLWVHNDSGDDAAVSALRRDGTLLARITFPDLTARDWEDMAIGPGPGGGDYLYLADIGDNTTSRPSVLIHRVGEPAPVAGPVAGGETLEITYPDGPAEAESLLVDPDTGDMVILGKALSGMTPVWETPSGAPWGSSVMAELRGRIPLGTFALATGADADATRIVVRTYDEAFLWDRSPGSSLAATLLGPGCRVARISEPQGEAVALAEEGFYTLSEGVGEAILYYESRKDP